MKLLHVLILGQIEHFDVGNLGHTPQMDQNSAGEHVLSLAPRDSSAVRKQSAPFVLDVVDELDGWSCTLW